ncbi:hypothetical protein GCM10027612_73040 [Microbispora bryophytorum subsp. camponoti]
MGRHEPGEHGRQVHRVQALQRADGQRSAQQALDGGHGVAGRVARRERPAGLHQQRPALGCEPHLPGVAPEQIGAQLPFERTDGRRQARLRDVQTIGRPSEVALFGDRHEVPELP